MNAIKSHSIKNKIKTTAKKLNIKYNIAWIILRVLTDKVEQIIKNPEKIKIDKEEGVSLYKDIINCKLGKLANYWCQSAKVFQQKMKLQWQGWKVPL